MGSGNCGEGMQCTLLIGMEEFGIQGSPEGAQYHSAVDRVVAAAQV
jgi:hypothetical protein